MRNNAQTENQQICVSNHPEAATLKYPHKFFEERNFNSWTVPELGLNPKIKM